MVFTLSSQNVFDYLNERNLCSSDDGAPAQVELVAAKNFNLLVSWPSGRQLLVKQERHDQDGQTAREFSREWRIQRFLQAFPTLSDLFTWLPELVLFDVENSILVCNYLGDYSDLF